MRGASAAFLGTCESCYQCRSSQDVATSVLKTHMSSATYGQAKNRTDLRFLAHLAVEVMGSSKIGFSVSLQFYCLENNSM